MQDNVHKLNVSTGNDDTNVYDKGKFEQIFGAHNKKRTLWKFEKLFLKPNILFARCTCGRMAKKTLAE